jgi:hypothetical protein
MKVQTVLAKAHSSAPAADVYAVLTNREVWPRFSRLDSVTLDQPGDGDSHGVGAVCILRRGRLTAREQVVELVPDRRMSYVLLSGLPLRGYRADIDLTPTHDGGTDVSWCSRFKPTIPGTGRIFQRVLTKAVAELAAGVAAEAERTRPTSKPNSRTEASR